MTKQTKGTRPPPQRVYMVRTLLVLVLVALSLLIGGGVIYVRDQTATKTYTSDNLDVQFIYPQYFLIKENLNDVLLEKNGQTINFGSYGSYYNVADEHVKQLIQQNKIKVKYLQRVPSKYSAMVMEFESGDKVGRSYFFVNNYAVYYFSTNDPALFPDLDKIARSFRILE